ncbi:MAG: 2-amino-4-hydroxy-6-hydroxymethyldihydropteridine diphosphokinase [Sphingomonas bacterium]|uniref:2-amino-4-hydroxy-6- hydroxymethyldihydropteridine diphosphokinase n=1 Tax=Sphingomonas bacterium TaxID=1895847 RepID=UPI0026126232|nr:2-amino-4-hydroxy-6-hydroxymethyldihydropteridine diphosphokinase [Sphingomonas bacterium]MDB5707758.1 2-amino-4-hydroxy-6-hydroxymethyldihydropteridine diphosphokinase [Sphingomonas bacterium]
MPVTRYAIAIGSNRPGLHGRPEAELRAALVALEPLVAASPVIATAPLGPSSRRFVNAVAIVDSAETPPAMLSRLKAIERAFGRRPGRRWGARVIDLDIILWSGGIWTDAVLTVPHAAFRTRRFVLDPLDMLVPAWRDPVTGLTVRQLAARARAVDRRPRRS